MPYALQKMTAMDDGRVEPGFAIELALKDLRLAATDGGYGSPLLDAVTRRFEAADAAGLGPRDVAGIHLLQREGDDRPDDD
jgi:3-hydroxyisobutyrate dehydrogenase